jgi:heme/copper-type cytochrome/quinol oxidase subunit 3
MAAATVPAGSPADDSAGARAGSATLVGVWCFVVGGALFMATVAGSYVSVRNGAGGPAFVPSEMTFNNYGAVTGFFSALFASVAMEYAVVATRAGQKTWSSAAHGLAILTMAGAANLAWSIGRNLGLGVADSSYAAVTYGVIAAAVGLMLVAIIGAVISLSRVLVGHATSANWLPVRGGALLVHLGMAAWACAWATIYLYK